MDERYIGAADRPPSLSLPPTGGDRATEKLLQVPPTTTYATDPEADKIARAAHDHLSLVTLLAGSEH